MKERRIGSSRCAFLLMMPPGVVRIDASTFGDHGLKRAPLTSDFESYEERSLAKAKAKAAVKRKPAKAPTRAVAAAPKAAAARPAKAIAAKAAKSAPAKTAMKAATRVAVRVVKTPDVAVIVPRTTQQLSLPAAKTSETPTAKPQPVLRKPDAAVARRADLPPADGFTLLVDGHFKSSFDDLRGAKAAASELKGRFPMLRVEIYDAAKKARLPA